MEVFSLDIACKRAGLAMNEGLQNHALRVTRAQASDTPKCKAVTRNENYLEGFLPFAAM